MSKLLPEISTLELEKQVIAGLIQFPRKFFDIQLDESDFSRPFLKTIFLSIKEIIQSDERVDYAVIANRIGGSGLSQIEDVSVLDFCQALSLRPVEEENLIEVAKELARASCARKFIAKAREFGVQVTKNAGRWTFEQMQEAYENVYRQIEKEYVNSSQYEAKNVFEYMPDIIDGIEEEDQSKHWFSQFPLLNAMCGSIYRPSDIFCVLAPTGQGKSTFAFSAAAHIADKYNGCVLHLDFNELSFESVTMRLCAQLSGVPYYYIESGKYRRNKEMYEKVKAVYPRVKKMRLYYKDIGGMSIDEICSFIKRFYYTKCKNGERVLISLDYLKSSSLKISTNEPEWLLMGTFLDKLKKLINTDLLVDGKPVATLMCFLQTNAAIGGMMGNKRSKDLNDSEDAVSLSKRLMHLVSWMFLMRKKMPDEIQQFGNHHGTHILKPLKCRHLGEDKSAFLDFVKVGDTLQRNYINLKIENFNVEEVSDLRKAARELEEGAQPIQNDIIDDLPEF